MRSITSQLRPTLGSPSLALFIRATLIILESEGCLSASEALEFASIKRRPPRCTGVEEDLLRRAYLHLGLPMPFQSWRDTAYAQFIDALMESQFPAGFSSTTKVH